MPKRNPVPRSSREKADDSTAKVSSGNVSGPKTIAVDFDGVIADYDGWKGYGVLGAPRRDVVEALRLLHAEGWKIIVHTTRGEAEISGYLAAHGIPHHEVNRNSDYHTNGAKPVADVYWDDRAFRYSGDARRDILEIRRFRTWSGRE
jgi:adenylylsulfate kinase